MCACNTNNTTEMIKDITCIVTKINLTKNLQLVSTWPSFYFNIQCKKIYTVQKDGQVETNCKFFVKLILVTMQCNHLLSSQ